MITLYKGYIWDSFGEFVESVMSIAEFLKVCFRDNALVFYDRENYFIDDVWAMFGQEEVLKSLHSVWRLEYMSRKTMQPFLLSHFEHWIDQQHQYGGYAFHQCKKGVTLKRFQYK